VATHPPNLAIHLLYLANYLPFLATHLPLLTLSLSFPFLLQFVKIHLILMYRRCNVRPLTQSGSVVSGGERPLLRDGSQRAVRIRLLAQPVLRVVDVYEVSNELLICETERRRSTYISAHTAVGIRLIYSSEITGAF
jgi:hypothetical protein